MNFSMFESVLPSENAGSAYWRRADQDQALLDARLNLVRTMSGRHHRRMTTAGPPKSERIDVRASSAVKQLLQEAARVSHKNVSEFLLDAGIVAANQTLADWTRFELSPEQWRAFQAALDRPVRSKPKLKKLLTEPGLLD
jgi:uncharacterized protein (DUF1778 family)